ncbi:hypothetical protein [Pedobacter nanyangensis]|uniref:hypothetical protein n=1 Tax=Pedobacter nanyangensis TaxID=1562389 RepID=UPI0013B4630B|nr:hypothetical protein [Pedobacter nanyangensis]
MKNRIFVLVGLTVAAFAILLALGTNVSNKTRHKNGFSRSIIHLSPTLTTELPFIDEVRNVCGSYDEWIFIETATVGKLYKFSSQSHTLDTVIIPMPKIAGFAHAFSTEVLYPFVYINSSYARCQIRYNLLNAQVDTMQLLTGGFTNAVMLHNGDVVVKAIDTPSFNSKFKKVAAASRQILVEKNLSPELGDAGITLDGKLSYDPSLGLLVYVCYYNNQITCFDTTLKKVYNSRTIDTVKFSPVGLKKTSSYVSFAKPPFTINAYSTVAAGRLYVKSLLNADDETTDNDHTVIDVYSVTDGRYSGSFYLPKPKKQVPLFKIYNDRVIVLSKHLLSIYSLNLKQLPT